MYRLILSLLALALLLEPTVAAPQGKIVMIKGAPSGFRVGGASISGNGRYLTYTYYNYTRGTDAALYKYDIAKKKATRITPITSAKVVPYDVRLSFSGRYVAFQTKAAFAPDDGDKEFDLYLYDSLTGKYTWLTPWLRGGAEPLCRVDGYCGIHDKKFIGDDTLLFSVEGSSSSRRIVSYNLNSGMSQEFAREIPLYTGGISADGRYVLVPEWAVRTGFTIFNTDNLAVNIKDPTRHTFYRYDRLTGELWSYDLPLKTDAQGFKDFPAVSPVLSADGKFAMFFISPYAYKEEDEVKLDPGFYLLEIESGALRHLSTIPPYKKSNYGYNDPWTHEISFTADGTLLILHSAQPRLVKGDRSRDADLFKINLNDNSITHLTKQRYPRARDRHTYEYYVSQNGERIVFLSSQQGLVKGDKTASDLFLYTEGKW